MIIFVVEDAPEIRKRFIAMVRRVAGINVVGEADSVNEAIDGVLASTADTMLLDLQLKDGIGLEVLTGVKQAPPGTKRHRAHQLRHRANPSGESFGRCGFLSRQVPGIRPRPGHFAQLDLGGR